MAHVFEPATSGRARCRGCGQAIARSALRFGERIPNAYAEGEGETTLWFHPLCAAYKRPEQVLAALAAREAAPAEQANAGDTASSGGAAASAAFAAIEAAARKSAAHRRLARIDGAERAPTGQAKCRSCREPIARGTWRIRIVYFEEGRFTSGGFLHLDCRERYFEGHPVRDAVLHFTRDEGAKEELARLLGEEPRERAEPAPQAGSTG